MRILIIINHDGAVYSFRRELVEALLQEHEVHFSAPRGESVEKLEQIGCIYHPCEFNRHGTNPVKEVGLFLHYCKLLKQCRPDAVLTYTIKPNVYGGMACNLLGVPYIANITGLGGAVEGGGLMQMVTLTLYRLGLARAQKVFFQNAENRRFMLSKGIATRTHDLLPGSGVSLKRYAFEPYPEDNGSIALLVIGRLMRDKGTDEVLAAARKIRKEYPHVVFRLIGSYDGPYQEKVEAAVREGAVEYWGWQTDIHGFMKDSHATVHASYHEGMSNVLLETAAVGRPIIATDVPGCRETYDDGVTGFSCKARDADSLVEAIKKFLELPYDAKAQMGAAGRKKMEREFDRAIVVDKYIQELNKIQSERR